MKNKRITEKNKYIKSVYLQIAALALLVHFIYMCIFLFLDFDILVQYNLFSVIFYTLILVVIVKERYKTAVICVHIEVALFVSATIFTLGWNSGFALYLFAMVSIVYFWPFKNSRWSYLCAVIEVFVYITFLITSSHQNELIYQLSSHTALLLSIFNAICCFTVMIYGAFISGVSSKAIDKLNADLLELADNDQLTGLKTRHYLFEQLNNSTSNYCNITIGDIDDYKHINDTYGHLCGDFVLQELAELMEDKIPDDIIICRWGGEEFIFLSFNSSVKEMQYVMERFSNVLRQHLFIYEQEEIKITMTFGISDTMRPNDLEVMIKNADDRLYLGKRLGKNQIVVDDIKK